MNRKNFLKKAGLISAGSAISPMMLKWFRQNGPFYPIRNEVGYFVSRGGTIGWFTDPDALVVVDSQFPETAVSFIDGIGEYGGGPEKVLYNTHHHGDHVGGNPQFFDEGFEIFAHHNVPDLQRSAAEAQGNEGSQVYADNTFGDLYVMDIGLEQIMAKHYGPAHTSGDSIIWFRNSNIIHMGDLVFNRLYPFIDMNGGASIQGWITLLESVVEESDSDTIFIIGHGLEDFGVTGDHSDLLLMRDFLSKLLEHTSKGLEEDKSREEITGIDQFEEFPNHISINPRLSLEANLNAAYDELTSE